MIYYKGVTEKEVDGKKIFFRHDMLALAHMGDLQNIGLNEIIRDCTRVKLSTVAAFLYAGAFRYCNFNKKEVDFTMEDAVEWIGKIGLPGVLEMIEDCFKSPAYEEKNAEATVTGPLKMQSNLQSSTVA